MKNLGRALVVIASLVSGCSPAAPPKPTPPAAATAAEKAEPVAIPLGRLPSDVRPLLYELDLDIDPSLESFTGRVGIEIELTRERKEIWLHGNALKVGEVTVTPTAGSPIPSKYEQLDPEGVAKITLDEALAPGTARLVMKFEGPFSQRLNGLYRVEVEGEHYAFTQMEPVWTRQAFPCFDEPAFKTPFMVSVTAKATDVVIANTKETAREDAGAGKVRVRFAKTEPLPTYLIAFAVGPLDVVEAPPIAANGARKTALPFRGVTAKGRGKELAHALKNTPAILQELETYFDVGYPYDKLDIIAVPDKGGAMENAGAVTFREWLLLFDDDAPIQQKHAFAYVMAHELAHQWFGNLVTMPWWDDIWLNEAFATWMGNRIVHSYKPDYEANVRALSGVHDAMSVDSLLSARQIRQPVEKNDHIHAAFDRITYRKGGGVLSMIERWLGPETFRKGMQRYLRQHAHGTATADDLMRVLTETAGRDVGTPFRTFLMQPGLPNVHAELDCTGAPRLTLSQSRFLPLGSEGDAAKRWQVPVCVRYGTGKKSHEKCTLLAEPKAELALEGACPAWVMPNAGAAGYYQWSMPPTAMQALADEGLRALEVPEQVSFGRAVLDALRAGKLDAVQAAAALRPLARIEHPDVVQAPMAFISRIRYFLEGDPLEAQAEALGRQWFRHTHAKLGWRARASEGQRERLLRAALISFLLHTGRDPEVRKRGQKLARAYLGLDTPEKGIDPSVMDANFTHAVLAAAGEDADAAFFDATLAHLKKSNDEQIRSGLINALSHARDPALAKRARQLVLDPVLKLNESMQPFWPQLSDVRTRDAMWGWLTTNIDQVLAHLPPRRAGWLPSVAGAYCSAEKAAETESLFAPHLAKMPAGRHEIDLTREALTICAARKAKHLPSIRKLLGG